MKQKILIFTLCSFLILSCNMSEIPLCQSKIDYDMIPNHSRSISKNDVEKLNLERITIIPTNENSYTSLNGDFFLDDSYIYFSDKSISAIFKYDTYGKLLKKYKLKGRGANEIMSLDDICQGNNYDITISGASNDIYSLNRNMKRTKKSFIKWHNNNPSVNLIDKPDPNNLAIYEKEYNQNTLAMIGDSIVLFPIVTDHINYNGFESKANRSHFYENSYTLGWYNINTGILKAMFNRPPIYSKEKYLANYKTIKFDVGDNHLYFTYEADSLIYDLSLKENKIISFGNNSNLIHTKGRTVNSFTEASKQIKREYGHCTDLKYISQTHTLFRSLCRGNNEPFDSLQVYADNTLIGEYSVPPQFNVIGYIPPYYYGYGQLNNSDGSMDIYKFEL